MKKIITKSAVVIGITMPLLAFAEQKNLKYLIDLVVEYLNYAIYLLMALATVMFVWNIYKYFIQSGDSTNKAEAGKYVMWSVIGFFVILSFWGLVNILTNTLKLDNNEPSTGIFGSFRSSNNNVFDPNIRVNVTPNPIRYDYTTPGTIPTFEEINNPTQPPATPVEQHLNDTITS